MPFRDVTDPASAFASAPVHPTDDADSAVRRVAKVALAATLLLGLTVLLQIRVGAFDAGLGNDESSHYVSGLLIHDYLRHVLGASGGWISPMTFLRDFHSHYPLVGIGHWGPLYYVVEGVWMLVCGTGRWSVLLLSAMVTTATALIVGSVAVRRAGLLLGAAAAIGLVASRVIQDGSSSVMLDNPIALLCLLAMLAYARFAAQAGRAGAAWWAALFGMLAGAGALIKGNAFALALLPPLFVLFSGRFDLLRRWSFWLPLPIVAVIALPWTIWSYPLVAQGFRYSWGRAYSRVAMEACIAYLEAALGPVVFAVSAVGLGMVVLSRGKRAGSHGSAGQDAVLVAASALLAAVFLFQVIVPAALQVRYLAPAIPSMMILAAEALHRGRMAVMTRLGNRGRPATAILFAVVALSAIPSVFAETQKHRFGVVKAASAIWHGRIAANPSVLIAANSEGEPAAVAELAMDDPQRPSLFVVRGSRLLAGGGYNNSDYVPRFATPAEAMAAVDSYAIPLVLLQLNPGNTSWRHIAQLADARRAAPERWQLVWQNEKLALFRIRGNDTRVADTARLAALSAPRSLGHRDRASSPSGTAAQ